MSSEKCIYLPIEGEAGSSSGDV